MKKWIAATAATIGIAGLAACGFAEDAGPATVTVTSATVDGAALEADRDESFLAQFRMVKGMDDLTQAEAVKLAHSTCNAMDAGNKVEILSILQDRYGTTAAAEFMHLSATVYCRDQLVP